MKFELKYTFDSKVMKQRLKCLFRHDWTTYQSSLQVDAGPQPIISWKVCERCAKSKLIHILS